MSQSSRRTIVGISIIILISFYWIPADGRPVQPIVPPAPTQPVYARPTRLWLATFNIHSGIGADDRLDLSRTSRVLQGAGLIAL